MKPVAKNIKEKLKKGEITKARVFKPAGSQRYILAVVIGKTKMYTYWDNLFSEKD